MTNANMLPVVDAVCSGDSFLVYSASNNDLRKAPLDVVKNAVKESEGAYLRTQYAAPNATGFSVAVNNDNLNVWLILTPLAGYASGQITLPTVDYCADQQTFEMNSTQAVAALTINGNGSQVNGAPTSIAQNGYFKLRFDAVMKTWYRVG